MWLLRQPEMSKWLYCPISDYIPGESVATVNENFNMTKLVIKLLLTLYFQLEHIFACSLALVDWNRKVLMNARVRPSQMFYQNAHEYAL